MPMSEAERRDLLDKNHAAQLEKDFEQARQAARRRTITLDHYVAFLSMMSRLCPSRPSRPFTRYSRVLL